MPEFDFGKKFTYETFDGLADSFMQSLDPAKFCVFFGITTHRKACRRSPDVWDLSIGRVKGLTRVLHSGGTTFSLSATIMFGMNKCRDATSFFVVC